MQAKTPLVALVGPTCTGKTALSLHLAKELGGEIVACDSRTVYRYFDIGTAKPSPEDQDKIKHYLIDVVYPEESFTVVQYRNLAQQAITQITSQGKVPIVCGGTGFYARALLEGLVIPAVPPQMELRAKLEELAEQKGNEALWQYLAELDSQASKRIEVNDRFRMIRAIEVSLVSGKSFSSFAGKIEPPYNVLWIGLTVLERDILRKHIKKRLKQQEEQGLLDEVQSLYKRYGSSQKLMKTVNYADLVRYVEGELAWEEAWQECAKHNYQLARRQLMWFKSNPAIHWFSVDEMSWNDLERAVLTLCQQFIQNSLGH